MKTKIPMIWAATGLVALLLNSCVDLPSDHGSRSRHHRAEDHHDGDSRNGNRQYSQPRSGDHSSSHQSRTLSGSVYGSQYSGRN